MMSVNVEIPQTELSAFCQRYRIRKLALFGSVLRDDFTRESDVDVLVEFEPDARVGLITLASMEIELTRLFGRKAEIHTIKGLNPQFWENVLARAEMQYEHAR